MKALVFAVFALMIAGCSSLPLREEALPAPSAVDIEKYMGSWYIIANIPTFIERESVNAMESYRWDPLEKRIYIDYSHHHLAPQGQLTSFLQEAWLQDESNAKWKVRPIWPLQFDYVILDVAPDYSYSLVGVPDKSSVWIMCRSPKMSDDVYGKLVSRAEQLGFDTSKLRKVPQVW